MTHLCQVDSGFWELEIARPVHLVEVQGGRRCEYVYMYVCYVGG